MIHKILLYFFLLYCSVATSQPVIIFEQSQNESFTFKYNPSTEPSQTICNYFIQEVSKSIPKILAYTQYNFSYNQYTRITREPLKEYEVSVELKDSKCSGDVMYKGFDIADVLVPNKSDLTVSVFYTNGTLFKKTEIKGATLSQGFNKVADFKIQDTTLNPQYKIVVENKKFYYDEFSKKLFEDRMKLVEDYFNSDAIISIALQKLQIINFSNIDLIQLNDIKLDEVEVMVDQLINKKYSEKLKLLMYDPIKFMSKLDNLEQQTKSKRIVINQMMATLDHLYYNKGLEYMVNGNMPMAVTYFEKSTDINIFYSPAHYQLAKINYNNGNIDKAVEIVKVIFAKTNPDHITHSLVMELSNSIYNSYLSKGQENIDGENYNDALIYLNKAKDFCTTIQGLLCTDILQKKISIAKYGIYRSYLTVATKSLESGKLELAENYITEGKTYQLANSNEIITSTDADALMGDVIYQYIQRGLAKNAILDYDKAMVNFTKAVDLYKLYPTLTVNKKLKEGISIAKSGVYRNYLSKASEYLANNQLDKAESTLITADNYQVTNSDAVTVNSDSKEILNKIKYQRYLKAIDEGIQNLLSDNNDTALSRFELARTLENNYRFNKDVRLDSLTQSAVKPVLLKNIESAKLKVWGNNLTDANVIYQSVIAKQEKYKLKNDTLLIKSVKELKDKISTQECTNAQTEYDNEIKKAQEQIKNFNYIDAIASFETAVKIAVNNAGCAISSESANENKVKYQPAANYQKLILEVDAGLNEDKFSLVIEKYLAADKYFTQNNIHQFGLAYKSLFDFISAQNNSNFISYATGYYTDQKDFDKALALLNLLKQRNYPLNYARTLQESLGDKLAERDKKLISPINPKTTVLTYTKNDKWLKYLKTVYLKAYKKY